MESTRSAALGLILIYIASHIWEILLFVLLLILTIAVLVGVRRLGHIRSEIDDMDERVYRLGRMLYKRLPRREYGGDDETEDGDPDDGQE